ncbi:MAG: sigma-70 family RNA polymerase sigma factor [Clostridia bacterium]|nr:sigma-70 family RNA polymerase sigma factor [Clostridia bacterium]
MEKKLVEKKEAFSDEQLISLIKSGESERIAELFERYSPYIKKSAYLYEKYCDVDDLISEGELALYLAIYTFDNSKASFKTYAVSCIRKTLMSRSRFMQAKMRIPRNLISSLDEEMLEPADDGNPENMVILKENVDSLMKSLKGILSDYEYSVICDFIEGLSYKEIAAKHAKSEKSVDNALKRIREKIKR